MGFTSKFVIHGKWVQAIKTAMDREFIHWFDVGRKQRPGWDVSHISVGDGVFSEVLSMMSPSEGAALLGSISVVNYRQAWWLLKRMALDLEYRNKVLEEYSNIAETPTKDHFGFEIELQDGNDLLPKDKDQQLPKTAPSDAIASPQSLCA